MKKLITLTLLTFSMISFAHHTVKEFTLIGGAKLNISKLEKAMSPGLSYAYIKVLDIRSIDEDEYEYDPFKLLIRIFNDREVKYVKYVIKFTLNGKDTAECVLTDALEHEDFMINDCESKSAVVDHEGLIDYRDVVIQKRVY